VLADAARSAQQRRVARNPREREEGANAEVIPVQAARVGTSPDNSAALLHLTTADQVPIAVELKPELLRELIEQLQRVADNLGFANLAAIACTSTGSRRAPIAASHRIFGAVANRSGASKKIREVDDSQGPHRRRGLRECLSP